MVVAYRFAAFTAFVLRSLGLVKVQFFSQPNLLAGRALVPEFLQEQVNGPALGAALLNELPIPKHLVELQREFRTLTRRYAAVAPTSQRPPSSNACEAVLRISAVAPTTTPLATARQVTTPRVTVPHATTPHVTTPRAAEPSAETPYDVGPSPHPPAPPA